MGLVDYSDSETSDSAPAPTAQVKTSTKPSFEKVVDRSNPHKIRVQLPQLSQEADSDQNINHDEPPVKKPRTGGGAFSGFNSMLPAPKRGDPGAGQSLVKDKGGVKGGLGSGFSLKTGAEPAFERRSAPDMSNSGEFPPPSAERKALVVKEESSPPPKHQDVSSSDLVSLSPTVHTESQAFKKPAMFKPLSVARKTQKKRAATAVAPPPSSADDKNSDIKSPSTPRPSLFSIGKSEQLASTVQSDGEYKPLIYETNTAAVPAEVSEDMSPVVEDGDLKDDNIPPEAQNSTNTPSTAGSTTLNSIANDLGLDENAKRQLFGRQRSGQRHQDQSTVQVINFSTDQEYAANEALRAAGETVQHNPVRAIAPGKHSLKQLVSAASNQRGALEEHFAAGRRNKKEAGSRYGW